MGFDADIIDLAISIITPPSKSNPSDIVSIALSVLTSGSGPPAVASDPVSIALSLITSGSGPPAVASDPVSIALSLITSPGTIVSKSNYAYVKAVIINGVVNLAKDTAKLAKNAANTITNAIYSFELTAPAIPLRRGDSITKISHEIPGSDVSDLVASLKPKYEKGIPYKIHSYENIIGDIPIPVITPPSSIPIGAELDRAIYEMKKLIQFVQAAKTTLNSIHNK